MCVCVLRLSVVCCVVLWCVVLNYMVLVRRVCVLWLCGVVVGVTVYVCVARVVHRVGVCGICV